MLRKTMLFPLRESITLLLLNISLLAFSQNYSEGTVILNNSDSIIGFIRISTENDFTQLIYKKDNLSNDSIFYPKDIKRIIFNNGELYESFTFTNGNEIIIDFFRCIVQGKVSLYSRFDNQYNSHLYLKVDDKPLQELIERKEIVDLKEKTDPLYYRVLGEAYNKCPKLLGQGNLIKLNENSIKNSVVAYHKCINEPYRRYDLSKDQKLNLQLPFQYGLYYGKIFSSSEFEDRKYKSGYNIGFLANFFFYKNNETKSIQCELVYTKHTLFPVKKGTTDTDFEKNSAELLALRLLFKYYIDFNKSAIYSGVGFTLFPPGFERNNLLFLHLGYTYNLGKVKLFTELRYVVLMNKSLSANIGIILNSKKNKIKH